MRKNGTDLTCDSRITGCTTPTLTISPVQSSDAGQYDVIVSDSCGGSTTSAEAALLVPDGDFDADGGVGLSDYQYIRAGLGSCAPHSVYLSHVLADLDNDGCITLVDYQLWLQAYRCANGRDFVPPVKRVPALLPLPNAGVAEDSVDGLSEP